MNGMGRLSVQNPLFEKLSSSNSPKWWNVLVKDKDISIQIRKDNYIDVYYNGGNIIRKLTFDGKSFNGEIHSKYIPVESETREYTPFLFGDDSIEFDKARVMQLASFSKTALKRVKENISWHHPSDSEKAIQYAFIKNDPYFIDSEFEYKYAGKKIRIDLVRLDIKLKKIVFVEVKTMGDRRLYNNEIVSQLKDYKEFITVHKTDLVGYYKKVLEIKRKLKLVPEQIATEKIEDYEVLDKPLLLFGDCGQDWIDKNSNKLKDRIKPHAVGCYYFGKPKYSCEINNRTNGNRHVF
jgi:hypothetical protein